MESKLTLTLVLIPVLLLCIAWLVAIFIEVRKAYSKKQAELQVHEARLKLEELAKESERIRLEMKHLQQLYDKMLDSRYETISREQTPMRWRTQLDRMEGEVPDLNMGFYQSHYTHNATITDEGLPNFSSVWLSPEGVVVLMLEFSLFALDRGEDGKPDLSRAVETAGADFLTMYSDPLWLLTTIDTGKKHDASHQTPQLIFNRCPKGTTVQDEYESHLKMMESDPWSARRPVPVVTLEDYQKMRVAYLGFWKEHALKMRKVLFPEKSDVKS